MHATEQVSPQLNGRAALSMNVTKTQPQGQRLQMPMSGRVEARGSLSCVQDTCAIERGTTYSSTLPCASLWTEPGAAITTHSNAPPSQAAWMDGPALAAVAVLNFAFHLVWSFFAIARGMMYVVFESGRPPVSTARADFGVQGAWRCMARGKLKEGCISQIQENAHGALGSAQRR